MYTWPIPALFHRRSPALPLLVPLAQRRIHVEEAESMPAFNRASHLVSIRARSGQSHRLGLRYELRQADGDADLWLLHSEWSDEAAMQAYLSGDAQRVFAEVLWQALAATLDVQERPF
ncbi:putative quinol monooxygenase [Pseudomonas aeruginosa]|uniref:putative quinol monooxygenase n=1 Tax=Pseudomonas aeruginosa TaxID=287 RepID=UPI0039E0DE57|nr:antibiotic biosynthesis monooxygenase [Pseudomonas aeruginosa]